MFSLGKMGGYVITSLKGATVVSYIVDNAVIIFPQTVIDSKARGGIPLCFPFLGPPKPRFSEEIPQHGWLRDQKFTLYKVGINSFTFRSLSCMSARKSYPWTFVYEVEISLELERRLIIELRATRLHGIDELAPVNPAFHPYFCNLGKREVIIDGKRVVIESGAAKIVPVGKEILIDMGTTQVEMTLAGDFNDKSYIVLWTDNAERYFCVEPVLTHPDDFDTPKGKFLDAGQMLKLYCSLSVLL